MSYRDIYRTSCFMDKREEKTLNDIQQAFAKLLNQKDYLDITIQDIINEAGIARSTFYSHFKTKDELLLSVSNHIFEHVFSHSLQEEKTHDFSKDLIFDFHHLIIHIFYHIHDEKELFKGILSSNGSEIFLNEFRIHLAKLNNSYYHNYPNVKGDIPLDLRKSIDIENFVVTLKYWIKNDFKETPEEIGHYYLDIFLK